MAQITLNINGFEVKGNDGQTILEIAQANGIFIPTLCHDERVKTFGACGVCLVEGENNPKLMRACATAASNGMVIQTDTPRVQEARKIALEFLLSDHAGDCRPPCLEACPGHTDCQGYVGLIANGQYEEALAMIKNVIPLPASIGRVCPHPCEEACRRAMVEEPIGIAHLKAFAADLDMASESPYTPDIAPDTGKKVAIIGGGPGGLTAAYFLRRYGHAVTVYDAMDKMGGMLRYGIPEYRLPKAILDAEIRLIEKMGVKMVNNVKVGKDMTFDHIKNSHDATVLAIGAWVSSGLRCPGEDLDGVLGGIDFLRDVAQNNPVLTGKKVAIVGGGNTAMDACRTAVRLGAEAVYNVYRRTKAEMPAEPIEIQEAEEEGVIFKNLTNPIEILGTDGHVSALRLQIMELGEPDASGRRAPVAVPGAEETLDVDTVILAIGQGVNPDGMEGVELSKWKTIVADENTFRTNLPGVYAVGDATNKGASIAIEAIGDAKRAADVIHSGLNGAEVPYKKPFIVTREMTPEKLAHHPKVKREAMPHLKPEVRRHTFDQVNLGYTEAQAKAEASRCLECGCADYFECRLIDYANRYGVNPAQFAGETHHQPEDTSNPFIVRNPNKCILCGLCVRVCEEVMGRTALGFVERGFDTVIKPAMDLPLAETDCISCGQCVNLCPTGALCERLPVAKNVPLEEETTHSVCGFCSVGCGVKLQTKGRMLLRSLPDDSQRPNALLCAKGRFGTGEVQKQPRLAKPLICKDDKMTEVSMAEALLHITKKTQGIAARYGTDALAVAISDKYINEDIYVMNRYAREVLKTHKVFSFNSVQSGLKEVFGQDASPNTLEELPHTDVIVLVCDDVLNSHTVAGIVVKKAVEKGAKLILVSNKETQADEWATMKLTPGKSLKVLKEMTKALLDMGKKPQNAQGLEALAEALKGVTPGEEAAEAAKLYANAKKAMIVYDAKGTSTDAQRMLADMAVLSGHIGKPRAGMVSLLSNSNSQGLVDMGVQGDSAAMVAQIEAGTIKGLVIFGEDVPGVDLSKVEFVAVSDYHLTETAEMAHVVLPAATMAESCGTYTSMQRQVQRVRQALPALCGCSNWELVRNLANVSQKAINYERGWQIRKDISQTVPGYAGLNDTDWTKPVFVPMGDSPVLYQKDFALEGGQACLQVPVGDCLFTEAQNTHSAYNRFMHFMDSKQLIK